MQTDLGALRIPMQRRSNEPALEGNVHVTRILWISSWEKSIKYGSHLKASHFL